MLGPPANSEEAELCGGPPKIRTLRWRDFTVVFLDDGSGFKFNEWAIGAHLYDSYELNPDKVSVPDQVALPPGVTIGMTLADFKTRDPTTAESDSHQPDTQAAFAAAPSDPSNFLRGLLAGPYADPSRVAFLGYGVDLLGC